MSGTEQSSLNEGVVKAKGKRNATAVTTPAFNVGPSTPTTFFLRTERDMEKGIQQRGRKLSKGSLGTQTSDEHPRAGSSSSSFGVQSLEDTINSVAAVDTGLARVDSYGSEVSSDNGGDHSGLANKKRKAGNPVHPKIAATGQRILSSEFMHSSSTASPTSFRSAESPLRSYVRRDSASSVNYSQPISPIRLSPHPESAHTSTPRSGSAKSFRSSEDGYSAVEDTNSQAIGSSVADADDIDVEVSKLSSMPQLVMPSIAMPIRRPFSERGRRMGRLKVMVVGPKGVGKTSLIQSILRSCEDVIHVDPPSFTTSCTISSTDTVDPYARSQFAENLGSTRPYPSWWTDMESRRMLLRRKSMGEGVLERNLCFIDTPASDDDQSIKQISRWMDDRMRNIASLESMNDSELITLLSGEGGAGVDAVLWLFNPPSTSGPSELSISESQKQLFEKLSKLTNVIPLVGRSDGVDGVSMRHHKEQILSWLASCSEDAFTFHSAWNGVHQGDRRPEDMPQEPFTVSSALGSDAETIDASVLMASQYLPPLVSSELAYLTERLLDPENISRMRHLAATKFLLWRHDNLGAHLNLHKQALLKSPQFSLGSPTAISTRSNAHESSKVLVPYGSSSYYRSTSPSVSDVSSLPPDAIGTSAYALERHNDQPQNTEQPFRQIRLAKWAQELQRSLDNERRKYQQMYFNPPTDWTGDDGEITDQALAITKEAHRPARGRLGGEIAVIDPRDPLGVLAFSQAFRRRGFFALQFAGGFGLVGAVAFWVFRNWAEVQDFFGLGQPSGAVSVPAVPPPSRGWLNELDWKTFFGWGQ